MIDIHCHILPYLDDGPDNVERSIEMAAIAADDGIKKIVATPHTGDGVYENLADKVRSEVKKFNNILKEKGINIEVLPGNDLHVYSGLVEDLEEDKVLTINDKGKYIMLEMPKQSVPFYIENCIKELKEKKIKVVISHPERNYHVQNDIRIVKKFLKSGAILQITAMSLTGGFGTTAQKTAVKLVKKGMAGIIASDAHSRTNRPPILSESLEEAARLVGEKKALDMVIKTPHMVIS